MIKQFYVNLELGIRNEESMSSFLILDSFMVLTINH
jgi:hypothetical protein